jgi:hypothetical protein
MTRASINLREKLSRRVMDHRVKPGDDDFEKHVRSSTGDVINPTGKSPKACPAPSRKIFRFAIQPNHLPIHRRPASPEGRFAIVTDVRRDAMDASGAADESA